MTILKSYQRNLIQKVLIVSFLSNVTSNSTKTGFLNISNILLIGQAPVPDQSGLNPSKGLAGSPPPPTPPQKVAIELYYIGGSVLLHMSLRYMGQSPQIYTVTKIWPFLEISKKNARKWYILVSHDPEIDKMILGNLVSTFIVCYHQF